MQSDLDVVVNASKRLESLLEQQLGATGRGLHEKISSVEQRLDDDVVRDLRFIATVRNKLVHENDKKELDDRQRFEDVAEICAQAIASTDCEREKATLRPHTEEPSLQGQPVWVPPTRLEKWLSKLAWWDRPEHRDANSTLGCLSLGIACVAAIIVFVICADNGVPFVFGLPAAIVALVLFFVLGPLVVWGLVLLVLYWMYSGLSGREASPPPSRQPASNRANAF